MLMHVGQTWIHINRDSEWGDRSERAFLCVSREFLLTALVRAEAQVEIDITFKVILHFTRSETYTAF